MSWDIACKKVLEDPAMRIVGHYLGAVEAEDTGSTAIRIFRGTVVFTSRS